MGWILASLVALAVSLAALAWYTLKLAWYVLVFLAEVALAAGRFVGNGPQVGLADERPGRIAR